MVIAGIWDWGIWDLLTRYSLSCPWMVSRCTRVQVRAMAVLFKTLILTSVGAALGSGWAGIKRSGRYETGMTLELGQMDSWTPPAVLFPSQIP